MHPRQRAGRAGIAVARRLATASVPPGSALWIIPDLNPDGVAADTRQNADRLKLPTLFGHAGAHIHGQVAVGVVITGVTAYLSVRYLVRYFRTRTLLPFAVHSLIVGGASILRFAAF